MDSLSLILQLATLGFAFLAAAAALVVLLRKPKTADNAVADTVRSEADRIRSSASDEAQRLRQEVNEAIRGFQTATEAKLDATDARLAASARETREALAASFMETREGLTSTLAGLGEHQKERLDKVLTSLDALNERQGQAAETLRQSVEGRLDLLRTENAAKLDEMRKTVDEKLQTELEKRLGDSFSKVSEQLERVHKGLGEMQSLATGVGDLKKVLSNVKTRGILGEVQLGMLLDQFLAPSQYIANACVKPSTPHFDAQYGATSAAVDRPQPELKFTMTPRPCLTIAGTKWRMTLAIPLRFTSMTRENSSAPIAQSFALRLMSPALLSSKSGTPWVFKIPFAQAATCASTATSTAAKLFGGGNCFCICAVSFSERPQATTMCPRRTNSPASARPSPRVAPVIRMVRPFAGMGLTFRRGGPRPSIARVELRFTPELLP